MFKSFRTELSQQQHYTSSTDFILIITSSIGILFFQNLQNEKDILKGMTLIQILLLTFCFSPFFIIISQSLPTLNLLEEINIHHGLSHSSVASTTPICLCIHTLSRDSWCNIVPFQFLSSMSCFTSSKELLVLETSK